MGVDSIGTNAFPSTHLDYSLIKIGKNEIFKHYQLLFPDQNIEGKIRLISSDSKKIIVDERSYYGFELKFLHAEITYTINMTYKGEILSKVGFV